MSAPAGMIVFLIAGVVLVGRPSVPPAGFWLISRISISVPVAWLGRRAVEVVVSVILEVVGRWRSSVSLTALARPRRVVWIGGHGVVCCSLTGDAGCGELVETNVVDDSVAGRSRFQEK